MNQWIETFTPGTECDLQLLAVGLVARFSPIQNEEGIIAHLTHPLPDSAGDDPSLQMLIYSPAGYSEDADVYELVLSVYEELKLALKCGEVVIEMEALEERARKKAVAA